MTHCRKIKIIKTFVLWFASQLMKLISMNHNKYNKYLSACKIYNKKYAKIKINYWVLLIFKVIVVIKVVLKQWGGTKCMFKIFLGITPDSPHICEKC
jgi:hypothetical protein